MGRSLELLLSKTFSDFLWCDLGAKHYICVLLKNPSWEKSQTSGIVMGVFARYRALSKFF